MKSAALRPAQEHECSAVLDVIFAVSEIRESSEVEPQAFV